MNLLQGLARRELCVTLNRGDGDRPGEDRPHDRLPHPVYTPAGVAAQAAAREISGVHRTYYCGAYWGYGFHEDGVNSAPAGVDELGARRARMPRAA